MNRKFNWRSLVGIILNLILGVNFLLSAYAKIPTTEVLGWTIAESTPFNWTIAEWLARLVIGLELFLGVLFIFQLFIKKIAIPFSTLVIVFFSVYLFYILSVYGNEANCGCYGEMIPMTTQESLVKNGMILALLGLAHFFLFQIKFRFDKIVAILLCIGAFTLPIVLSPPASITIFSKEKIKNKDFPIHFISSHENYVQSPKKIVAMVSASCKYCKKAAKRIAIMKKRNPEIPFQFIMAGSRDHLAEFLEETRSDNIPLIFIDSLEDFQAMNARNAVPTIKWLEDSTVVNTSSYFSLNENEIKTWLKD